jgi:hypothetical protein
MAPVMARIQADQARLALEAQRTAALSQISAAAAQDAATNQQRVRLQSQALGQPQVFVPGQGFVPYPYGIAPPIR